MAMNLLTNTHVRMYTLTQKYGNTKKVIARHVPKLDFLGALISAEVVLWLILVC